MSGLGYYLSYSEGSTLWTKSGLFRGWCGVWENRAPRAFSTRFSAKTDPREWPWYTGKIGDGDKVWMVMLTALHAWGQGCPSAKKKIEILLILKVYWRPQLILK